MVNLDALLNSNLSVILDGKPVTVLPADGVAYQLIAAVKDNEDIEAMYKAAQRCLPSVPQERVMQMSVAQVNAVMEVACGAVVSVEANVPPFSAPAGKRGNTRKHS